ncbi:MAG: SdpI family protein [Oscillospiraceae bacterium]|nr:SdpI family protein [Oscillospiraceae bacterium]
MLKKNKGTIILTTLVTAAPVLLGLLLWSRLPDTIATHFDIAGEPNGWSSKAFAVFAIPGFLVVCQLLCTFGTMTDPRKKNIQQKMFRLVLWICPVISVLICSCMYLYALGYGVDMGRICGLLVGMLFIIIGNYLPKCRQTYTMGVKTPWTLADEENWNHTHRFGGRLWMAAGVVFLALTMLGAMNTVWTLVMILVVALLPALYSFLYYLRHQQEDI